jgi:hypothetical protein
MISESGSTSHWRKRVDQACSWHNHLSHSSLWPTALRTTDPADALPSADSSHRRPTRSACWTTVHLDRDGADNYARIGQP